MRAEARSPLGTHGADAGARVRLSGPPRERPQRAATLAATNKRIGAPTTQLRPYTVEQITLCTSRYGPVTSDLAELARRGGRRRGGVPVFVLALVRPDAGVHLVVQAVRLVDTS